MTLTRRAVLAAVLWLGLVSASEGAVRAYLMPTVLTVPEGFVVPKYNTELRSVPGMSTGVVSFRQTMWCIVVANGIDQATIDVIEADPDVYAFPEDLSGDVGNEKSALQSAFDTAGLVTDALNPQLSWRESLRLMIQQALVYKRLAFYLQGEFFVGGVTLNTPWNSLSAARQSALTSIGNEYGMDVTTLSGSNSVKQIIKALSEQWEQTPFNIAGVSI